MPWMGAAIAGGASLLGGFMRNDASAKAADKQMAMQDYWLRHRHQIEVADLEAAGLNPILSAGGNPPVPAGARAEVADPISPAVSSAIAYKTAAAQIEQAEAMADKTRAEAEKVRTEERQLRLPEEVDPREFLPHTPGSPLFVDTAKGSALRERIKSEGRRLYHEGFAAGSREETEYQEAMLRTMEVIIKREFGQATAREVLNEIVQRARRHESGAAADRASAWLHSEQARQERIDAGITETPGVRWIERGIKAGAGASSAYRTFRGGRR